MSKVNQIQRALQELGGAAFQKLVEHYLAKRGFRPLYPIGSVAGADKAKRGTPDALSVTEGERYVFFEHTTQQTGVAAKFADDLAKCLDEGKTGIAVEDIERVVLCSTSDLAPDEIDGLRKTAQEVGIKLDVVGLQDLSYELVTTYPGLARDHLGVEVDTGQILPPDEFVAAYGANALAAPLDTTFRFRSEEVDEVLGALDANNLVVIVGPAGVGKSRLALEGCARYAEQHDGCVVRCLYNRGADIYQDLRVHLAEPGHTVLFVDDANRLSAFDYVVQLIAEQRDDQRIKVVATVRDYAVDQVLDAARRLGGHGYVELGAFADDQIKDLAREEFEIFNGAYLERIATLAQGNPRLAVMAARVAVEAEDLRALHDATHLYEEYFASVRRDLQHRGDLVGEDLLQVAGIVGFFGVVDRENAEQMGAIERAFGLAEAEFWAGARGLHDLEVLDMYEREVVKPSDQILSTYLVYLAFFAERVLDVTALLDHFFPALKHRFVDALNPILSTLDDRGVVGVLEPAVRDAIARAEAGGDTDRAFHLVAHFAGLVPTDALHVAKERVEAMPVHEVAPDGVVYEPKSGLDAPSILRVLATFSVFDEPRVRLALRIVLDYAAKRPADMPRVVYVLTESYGPQHDSHRYGFMVQRSVVDELRSRAESDPVLFGRLLLAVAHAYLRCHFNTTASHRTNGLLLRRFDLYPSDGAKKLRGETWTAVLALYAEPDLREEVEALVRAYAMNARFGATEEIVAADAAVVLPFLEAEMETGRLLPCLAAHDALDFFEDHGAEVSPALRARFSNPAYQLLDLFLTDRRELRAEGLSTDEIREAQRAEIEDALADYDAEDYARLFENARGILDVVDQNREAYQVRQGLDLVLRDLARKDHDLLEAVLGTYLSKGDPLELQYVPLPDILEALGRNRILALLSEPQYDARSSWLLSFYASLPAESLREEDGEALLRLYAEADARHLGRSLDFLLSFRSVRPRILVEVVETLVERAGEGQGVTYALASLFNSYGEVADTLRDVFGDDVALLRRAYVAVARRTRISDYKGRVVNQILDLDPDFIDDFVDAFRTDGDYPRWGGDGRDYSYLWDRDDHRALVERAVLRFAEVDFASLQVTHSFLESIFARHAGKDAEGRVRRRQDATLTHLIEQHHADADVMGVVSALSSGFSGERRRALIAAFLRVNRDYDAFRTLELVPTMTVSWGKGGMVGAHLAKADFLESLLPLLDDVDLLEHKMYVERQARSEREWAEREKRRAFADL